MTKSLLLLIIFLKTVCASYSQDTICLKIEDARKVLIDASQKKVLEEKVKLMQKDIDLINARITEKESLINTLNKKDTNSISIIRTYEAEIKEYKGIRDTMQNEINYWQKLYIKQKRKAKWLSFGGIAAIIATIFIFK